MIPFVDLRAQYLGMKSEIDQAIQQVVDDCAFISGKYARAFETEFAAYCGAKHCIAVANGTDSLEILLEAKGFGPGDEIIVPAHTWISTAEAVSTCGATPVFVDSDEYYGMSVTSLSGAITERTKAIIPVHLHGHPANMPAIMEIASEYGLFVLEDCAQAHSAKVNGTPITHFGHASSFSFYPGKNLGAYGDAGCIVTNDDELARSCRQIANHGQEGKHNHLRVGRNSRMDGIQAAVLSAKLKHIDDWTAKRIDRAAYYNEQLKDLPVETPPCRPGSTHVFHVYVIQCDNRDGLAAFLKERGIQNAIHYPNPLHLTDCYLKQGEGVGSLPQCENATKRILSLPMFPELTNDQIDEVAAAIREFYG